jgi:hypothetical protein
MRWDLFICHAREDKVSLVEPLARALKDAGYQVWYDDFVLTLGDKLIERIQEGLSSSRYGLIILSPSFRKEWIERELSAFLEREMDQEKSILPVWHQLTYKEVREQFPILSSRFAVSSDIGIDRIVESVRKAIGPPQAHVHGLQHRYPARIDRDFWLGIDVQAVRNSLAKNYFGAESNEAIAELLATIEMMQQRSKFILDPQDFHQSVMDRWRRASSILLWGEGGSGKTYLAQILSDSIFNRSGFFFACQEAGGSHDSYGNLFRSRAFGSPPGYVGSDRLTDLGAHLLETGGFTVIVLDEVDRIVPDNPSVGFEMLYGLFYDRAYLPSNPALTGNTRVSLWNTIFVEVLEDLEWNGVPFEAFSNKARPQERFGHIVTPGPDLPKNISKNSSVSFS